MAQFSGGSLTSWAIIRFSPLEELTPDIFRINIERHPHLFGRASLGKPSFAFATVERIYEFDTKTETIKFVKEDLIKTDIN